MSMVNIIDNCLPIINFIYQAIRQIKISNFNYYNIIIFINVKYSKVIFIYNIFDTVPKVL
jgi:hypothetical protein